MNNQDVNTKEKFAFSGTIKTQGKEISKHIQEIDFYRKGNEYWSVYAYNIIDGILTKGKPQYAQINFKIYPN